MFGHRQGEGGQVASAEHTGNIGAHVLIERDAGTGQMITLLWTVAWMQYCSSRFHKSEITVHMILFTHTPIHDLWVCDDYNTIQIMYKAKNSCRKVSRCCLIWGTASTIWKEHSFEKPNLRYEQMLKIIVSQSGAWNCGMIVLKVLKICSTLNSLKKLYEANSALKYTMEN